MENENLNKSELFSDATIIENNVKEQNKCRNIEKFCDFTLKFRSSGASFKVHKVVLYSSCPFFRALFDSEMSECTKEYLEFKDFITEEELEKIIKYLYTGTIHIPITSAEKYYEHAHFFQLESLRDFCTKLLIENVQSDTCLCFWRFAVKYSNEDLKTKILEYILYNSEQLFQSELFLDLTLDEVKEVICSDKIKSSEDSIYIFVMKWLNSDFENRSVNIDKLIEEIRFQFISDNLMESEVLNNNFFLKNKNKEFQTIVMNILKSKLDTSEISCLRFNKINSPRIGICQENLMAIIDQSIYKFEKNDLLTKTLLLESKVQISGAKVTKFANNYLLLAGGHSSNKCWYYWPERNAIKAFPSMIESRSQHGVTTLHDKIYSCGGFKSLGAVEVFDLGAGVWKKGKNLNCERSNFGIATWDNCIYIMGGSNAHSAERYDPREDCWSLLPDIPTLKAGGTIRSIAFSNSVYGFKSSGGFIFDVRAHKWMETTVSLPDQWSFFDLTEMMGKVYVIGGITQIYGMFGQQVNNTYYSCTYDLIQKTWSQRQTQNFNNKNLSVFTMFT